MCVGGLSQLLACLDSSICAGQFYVVAKLESSEGREP